LVSLHSCYIGFAGAAPQHNVIGLYGLEYRFIQSDSVGICNTLGNNNKPMCVSKQKVLMNMGPISNGCRDGKMKISITCVRIKDCRHELRRAARSTLQRVQKCIEDGGETFENLL
jgi:hypothetical protein